MKKYLKPRINTDSIDDIPHTTYDIRHTHNARRYTNHCHRGHEAHREFINLCLRYHQLSSNGLAHLSFRPRRSRAEESGYEQWEYTRNQMSQWYSIARIYPQGRRIHTGSYRRGKPACLPRQLHGIALTEIPSILLILSKEIYAGISQGKYVVTTIDYGR